MVSFIISAEILDIARNSNMIGKDKQLFLSVSLQCNL